MGTDLYEHNRIQVTRYLGLGLAGEDRRRIQITTPDGYVSMSWEQWTELCDWIGKHTREGTYG